MLHVVLDTNVVGIPAFTSNAHRLLLEASREGRIVLVVPELVLRETANRWREEVESLLERRDSIELRLIEIRALSWAQKSRSVDAHSLAHDMRERLEQQLRAHGAQITALPDASHDDIVSRALARRQPFDSGGKDGYRDVLLWETVLGFVADGHDVALVSADRRAFSAKTEDGLSRNLAAEAEALAERPEPVRLYHDLRGALSTLLESGASTLAEAVELLMDDDVLMPLIEMLETGLQQTTLDANALRLLNLPVRIDSGSISHLEEIEDLELTYAHRATSGEVFVEGTFDVLVALDVRFPVESFGAMAATAELSSWGLDADDTSAKALIDRRATVSFETIVAHGEFTSVRVLSIEGFQTLP